MVNHHREKRLRASAMRVWCVLLGGVAALGLYAGTADASAHRVVATSHRVVAAAPQVAGAPDLGPNTYVFTPAMSQSDIQSTLDAISAQQVSNQFGTQRYALLFEPGTYGTADDPLNFSVGYYTEVAGLGTAPGDVTINGSIDVYNQCDDTGSCTALNNFWRSMSNLTINVDNPNAGCYAGEFWAVSQASPMRRVDIEANGENTTLMDYCTSPSYASGGFIADSAFSGQVISGSQQQWFTRNSDLAGGWSNGVWNQVFSGDTGTVPATAFSVAAGQYTTLATTQESEEAPFLQTDGSGDWSVFVPSEQTDSSGPSWQNGATPGSTVAISRFFIATPSTPVGRIDLALALGKNLILTPGVYDLSSPIIVSRKDTVVLGLGFPTLVPQNGTAAITDLAGQGVKISGLIADAGPENSPVLMRVGTPLSTQTPAAGDPTVLSDVFFRVGGATAGSATTSLLVDTSNTILDDIWAWRADHGNGVGWTENTAAHGLIVNGRNVYADGLAVEHYQQSQVEWNGQDGEDVFFQSEMPYDVPSQSAWMESPYVDGYPSFQVGPKVTSFTGYGMGSYSFFNQGLAINATEGFQVPDTPGVQITDAFTVFLNGDGGIQSVVNGVGAAVNLANPSTPSDVLSYPASPSGNATR